MASLQKFQGEKMIDKQHVLHIAKLARLSIAEKDVDNYTDQLGAIIGYVEQLNSVDTSNVEPTCFVVPEHDTLREDIEVPSLSNEQILANGPLVKKGCFAIPKVIG
jgi:aspartyl-tRNA(Asn)/glutamyl-tRNA(Gln) amidotransferase subunit C